MKTTLIIMGYDIVRINNNHEQLFKTYDTMYNTIDKIIFVWNNLEENMPILHTKNIELITIKSTRNSLCNRHHVPYKYIDTDSILIVDEDILLHESYIKKLLSVWDRNRDRVIGRIGRSYDGFGNYKYNASDIGTNLNYGTNNDVPQRIYA